VFIVQDRAEVNRELHRKRFAFQGIVHARSGIGPHDVRGPMPALWEDVRSFELRGSASGDRAADGGARGRRPSDRHRGQHQRAAQRNAPDRPCNQCILFG
jgi:hypothetical protein